VPVDGIAGSVRSVKNTHREEKAQTKEKEMEGRERGARKRKTSRKRMICARQTLVGLITVVRLSGSTPNLSAIIVWLAVAHAGAPGGNSSLGRLGCMQCSCLERRLEC
jgi:hypothetical protein